jgi:TetR/AcrR family transcriptional repressor of nem operon
MHTVKQPRALRTRELILRAATRLFTAKGFHDTTLDDVRRTAKVTTGAFFHHFRGKDDLGFAVLDAYLEQRGRELDEIEGELYPDPSDDPLEQVVRRLHATRARFVTRMARKQAGCIFGNLSTTLSDTHDGFRRRLAECFDAMAADFAGKLEAARRRYQPRRAIDADELARYIVSVLEGSIILARAHRDASVLARNFEMLEEQVRRTFTGA